jgi:hypothetical protein
VKYGGRLETNTRRSGAIKSLNMSYGLGLQAGYRLMLWNISPNDNASQMTRHNAVLKVSMTGCANVNYVCMNACGMTEHRLEDELQTQYQDIDGALEKLTYILTSSKVIIIKSVEPSTASQGVETWHRAVNARTKQIMEAIYWDGVTYYTVCTKRTTLRKKKSDI